MSLDDRKKRILREIVYLYEEMGEPVGSSILSQHIDIRVSTATLRAEMAALTRLGFLAQPHTSAGRVPSTAGYRYYLENLMDSKRTLKTAVQEQVDKQLHSLDRQTDRFMQGTAAMLSATLGLPAFTVSPTCDSMTIAHYRLLQIGKASVLIVAVGAEGTAYTHVVRTGYTVSQREQDVVAEFLNRHFCFVSAQDIDLNLVEILLSQHIDIHLLQVTVPSVLSILNNLVRPQLYFEGLKNLSFVARNGVSLDKLLKIVSDKAFFCTLAQTTQEAGGVLLCDDDSIATSGLAVMCERYHSGGGMIGYVGVLGPERMSYATAVPTVRYFARRISEILTT